MRQAVFFAIADEVLDDNSSTKSGWEDERPVWHLRRLQQELNELVKAVKLRRPAREVLREAADVANFAYFVASTYSNEYKVIGPPRPRRKRR